MRILKILIILLLCILPFGELIRFDIGNDIRFKPLDILTGIIFVYWITLYITKRIKVSGISKVYLLFPILGILSLAINFFWLEPIQLLASSFYLVRWVSYMGIFFVVMHIDNAFKKKILYLLIIDGVIILLLGFIQYFFFTSLKPLYYLGWDEHMYRLFSVFLDPNYTGGFFVLYLLFIGGLILKLLHTKRKSLEVTIIKKISVSKKRLMYFFTSIAALTLIASFITFSRSTLLMLITGVSLFFVLIGKQKLIFVFIAIVSLFLLSISSQFSVESMNIFRKASSNARLNNYQSVATIIHDHPFFGIGLNTYRYAKEQYMMETGWVNAPSHADAGVDNSFLFVLVTTGIVGLVAYLFMWFYVLKRAYFLYKKDGNIFAIIFISSSAGLFVHAMFINSLFFPAIMLWMWILLGLMENKLH